MKYAIVIIDLVNMYPPKDRIGTSHSPGAHAGQRVDSFGGLFGP